MAVKTDVIVNLSMNSKDVSKSAKELLNVEDIMERINGSDVSVGIKEDFKKAANYYQKNLGKLNLTKWFGDATNAVFDDKKSASEKENAPKDLLKNMKQLQSLRAKIGKDTDDLKIFDPKDLNKLIKSQEAIDKAEKSLEKARSKQEEAISKEAKKGALNTQADVLSEANKRKISTDTNSDDVKAIVKSLGEDKKLTSKKKDLVSNYFKSAGLMSELSKEFDSLKSGDLTDANTLKQMAKVGKQMVDTHKVVQDLSNDIVKTFDSNGEKGVEAKLKEYAKNNGFDRTSTEMQQYVRGNGDNSLDPFKLFVDQQTKVQQANVLKQQQAQQEMIRDAANRAIEQRKKADEIAQKASAKASELSEKSKELRSGNSPVSEKDVDLLKRYSLGLEDCISKIIELQKGIDNDTTKDIDKDIQEQLRYFEQAQQLAKEFGVSLKDEFSLRMGDEPAEWLFEDLKAESPNKETQKIIGKIKSGEKIFSDSDVKNAEKFNVGIREAYNNLNKLYETGTTSEAEEQEMLLWNQKIKDIAAKEGKPLEDYFSLKEMSNLSDIQDSMADILPTQETANILDIIKNGIKEVGEEASATGDKLKEMGEAGESAGEQAAAGAEKAEGKLKDEGEAAESTANKEKGSDHENIGGKLGGGDDAGGKPGHGEATGEEAEFDDRKIKITVDSDEALEKIKQVNSKLDAIPEKKEIQLTTDGKIDIPDNLKLEDTKVSVDVVIDDALSNIDKIKNALESLPEEVKVLIDSATSNGANESIDKQHNTKENIADVVKAKDDVTKEMSKETSDIIKKFGGTHSEISNKLSEKFEENYDVQNFSDISKDKKNEMATYYQKLLSDYKAFGATKKDLDKQFYDEDNEFIKGLDLANNKSKEVKENIKALKTQDTIFSDDDIFNAERFNVSIDECINNLKQYQALTKTAGSGGVEPFFAQEAQLYLQSALMQNEKNGGDKKTLANMLKKAGVTGGVSGIQKDINDHWYPRDNDMKTLNILKSGILEKDKSYIKPPVSTENRSSAGLDLSSVESAQALVEHLQLSLDELKGPYAIGIDLDTISSIESNIANLKTTLETLKEPQQIRLEFDGIQNFSTILSMLNQAMAELRESGNIKVEFDGIQNVSMILKMLDNALRELSDSGKVDIKLDVSKDAARLEKIAEQLNNFDGGNASSAFNEISSAINSLNIDNLKSLSQTLQKISGKNNFSENLNNIVDALTKLKTGLGEGGGFGDVNFLGGIKELLDRGDQLRDLATVLKSSESKIKNAQKATEPKLTTSQEDMISKYKAGISSQIKGIGSTDLQKADIESVRSEYKRISSDISNATDEEKLFIEKAKEASNSISKDIGENLTSQYEKLSLNKGEMLPGYENELNRLLNVINLINSTPIDLETGEGIGDLQALINLANEFIAKLNGKTYLPAGGDQISSIQDRFSKLTESDFYKQDANLEKMVSGLEIGKTSIEDIKKVSNEISKLESNIKSASETFVKDNLKDNLKEVFGETSDWGTLDKISNIKKDGSATLTFVKELDNQVKTTIVSLKDANAAMRDFRQGVIQGDNVSIEKESYKKRKLTDPEMLNNSTMAYFDNYNNAVNGRKFNDKRASDFRSRFNALRSKYQSGAYDESEEKYARKFLEDFQTQSKNFRDTVEGEISSKFDFLNDDETKSGKTNIVEYNEKLRSIREQFDQLSAMNIDPLDEESINRYAEQAEKINSEFKELENSKHFNRADENRQSALLAQGEQWARSNSKAMRDRDISSQMDEFRRLAGKGASDEDIEKATAALNKMKAAAASAGKTGLSFFDVWKNRLQSLAAYLTTFVSFYDIWNVFKQGVGVVRELDTALTEMRKVSDESLESLQQYQQQTFDKAGVIGTTAYQLQNSTADFMRLGESLDEASKSAETANVLMNVSEFESIDAATESLISMSAAYDDLEKIDIVDKLNNIGNNFAISTDGLAVSLQNSAAALSASGNTIDESIALITAANSVLQDPAKVGNALRTISMRMTGTEEAKGELEAAGEDVSDFVVQTRSKIDEQMRHFTAVASNDFKGVSMLDENGNYKSTYEVLQDIADVYDEIVETDKQFGTNRSNGLLELIAGKTRANAAAAILSQPDLLRDVYQKSQDSEGSAMQENEKYLDSVEGKIQQMQNRLQEFASLAINSDMFKGLIDGATQFLEILNNIISVAGMVPVALGAGGLFGIFKNLDNYIDIGKEIGTVKSLKSLESSERISGLANLFSKNKGEKFSAINGVAEFGKKYDLNPDELTEAVKLASDNKALAKSFEAMTENGESVAEMIKDVAVAEAAAGASAEGATAGTTTLSAAMTGLKTAITGFVAEFWPLLAIGGFIGGLAIWANYQDNQYKKASEIFKSKKEEKDKTSSELEGYRTELEEVNNKIDEINAKDKLSFTDQTELANLTSQREELERLISTQEELEKIQNKEVANAAIEALDKNEAREDLSTKKEQGGLSSSLFLTGQKYTARKTDYLTAQQNEVAELSKLKDEREKLQKELDGTVDESARNRIQSQIDDHDASIKDLTESLTEGYDVLKEYEEALSASDDPSHIERARKIREVLDDTNYALNDSKTPLDRTKKSLDNLFKGTDKEASKYGDGVKQYIADAVASGKDAETALNELGISMEDLNLQDVTMDINGDGIEETLTASQMLNDYFKELGSSAQEAGDKIKSALSVDGSFEGVKAAQESVNAGANWESMAGWIKNGKDLYEKGLVGTDDFQTIAQFLSPTKIDSSNQKIQADAYVKAWENAQDKIKKYFDSENPFESMKNFQEDAVSKGAFKWLDESEGISQNVSSTTAEIADKMGMSVEATEVVLNRLKDYGFEFEGLEWSGEQLKDYKTSLDEIQKTYDSLQEGEYKDKLGGLLANFNAEYSEYEQDMSKLDEDKIVHIRFEYNLAQLESDINNILGEIGTGNWDTTKGSSALAKSIQASNLLEEQTGVGETTDEVYKQASEKIKELGQEMANTSDEGQKQILQQQQVGISEAQRNFQNALADGYQGTFADYVKAHTSDIIDGLGVVNDETRTALQEILGLNGYGGKSGTYTGQSSEYQRVQLHGETKEAQRLWYNNNKDKLTEEQRESYQKQYLKKAGKEAGLNDNGNLVNDVEASNERIAKKNAELADSYIKLKNAGKDTSKVYSELKKNADKQGISVDKLVKKNAKNTDELERYNRLSSGGSQRRESNQPTKTETKPTPKKQTGTSPEKSLTTQTKTTATVETKIDTGNAESQLAALGEGQTIKFTGDFSGVDREITAYKDEEGNITYTVQGTDGVETTVEPLLNKDGTVTYVADPSQLMNPLDPTKQVVNREPNDSGLTQPKPDTQTINRKPDNSNLTSPGPTSQTVKRVVDNSATRQSPAPVHQKVIRQITTAKKTPGSSSGGISGATQLHGSAYATGSSPSWLSGLPKAYLNTPTNTEYYPSSWQTKKSQNALVGEVGPEMVVNGNRWWLVGSNGPEFSRIPSKSVVFNARQTDELLSNGSTDTIGEAKILGSAFVNGGLSENEDALINEVGEEGIVRNGKLMTVNNGKPAITGLKRGDVVFNAKQMEDLRKNGRTNTYAQVEGSVDDLYDDFEEFDDISAFLKGTAFLHDAGRLKKNNSSSGSNKSSGGSNTRSSGSGSSSNKSGSKKSSKSKKKSSSTKSAAEKRWEKFENWISKLFDWIEVRLDRLADRTEKWTTAAEKAVTTGSKEQIKAYENAIKSLGAELNANRKASSIYAKEAKTVGKKGAKAAGLFTPKTKKGNPISEKKLTKKQKATRTKKQNTWVNQVYNRLKNGKLDIKKYSEKQQTVIKDMQEWYDKSLNSQKAIRDLTDNMQELYTSLRDIPNAKADEAIEKLANQLNHLKNITDTFGQYKYTTYQSSNANLNEQTQNAAKQRQQRLIAQNTATAQLNADKEAVYNAVKGKKGGTTIASWVSKGQKIEIKDSWSVDVKNAVAAYNASIDAVETAQNNFIESDDDYWATFFENAAQKLDNIRGYFESRVKLNSAKITSGETLIDFKQARDYKPGVAGRYTVGESDYRSLSNLAVSNANLSAQSYNDQLNEMIRQIRSGELIYGSQQYYDDLEALENLRNEFYENAKAVDEWNKKIREMRWKKFEDGIAVLENTKSELSDIRDLLNSENFLDKRGVLTTEGLANLGLLGQLMEEAKKRIIAYRQALVDLDDDYNNGNITVDEYNEKHREFTEIIREAAKELGDYKTDFVDAYIESLERQNELLKENIEKRQDALSKMRDYYDYQKTIREKSRDVNHLEQQIAALDGVSNKAAQAKLASLRQQLAESREDLNDTVYNHEMDLRSEGYDKLADDADKALQRLEDSIRRSTEKQQQLVDQMLNTVKSNYNSVYTEINTILTNNGVVVSNEGASAIANIGNVNTEAIKLKDTIGTIALNTNNVIKGLTGIGDIDTTKIDKSTISINALADASERLNKAVKEKAELDAAAAQNANSGGGNSSGGSNKTTTATASQPTVLQTLKEQKTKLLNQYDVAKNQQDQAYAKLVQAKNTNASAAKIKQLQATYNNMKNQVANLKAQYQAVDKEYDLEYTKQFIANNKQKGDANKYKQKGYSDVNQKLYSKTNGYVLSTENMQKLAYGLGLTYNNASSAGELYKRLQEIKYFARGSQYIPQDMLGITQDKGQEVIYRRSDGSMLTPLGKGDRVFTADMTDNLWKLSKMNLDSLKRNSGNTIENITNINNRPTINMTFDSFMTVEGNVDKNSVQDLRKFKDEIIKDFTKQLTNDLGMFGHKVKF